MARRTLPTGMRALTGDGLLDPLAVEREVRRGDARGQALAGRVEAGEVAAGEVAAASTAAR